MESPGEMLSIGRPTTTQSVMFRPESKLRVSQYRRSVSNLKPIERKEASEYCE